MINRVRTGGAVKISKLTKVDIREVWPNEAADFTPWLEENSQELGDLLGMDLDLSKEHQVGAFSLDLNGIDLNTGRKVIIENQLEQSDHRHLGQLLTYAGGVNPQVVIWIAKDFREEHRAAMDWLNSVTSSETNFFGIAINAVRIDDSPAAPVLDIVVQPNAWTKGVREATAKAGYSERELAYQEFWSLFIDRLQSKYPQLQGRTPWPRPWFPMTIGVSGININFTFTRKMASVECYFGSNSEELNEERFTKLRASADHFDQIVGIPLFWDAMEGKKARRISINGEEIPNIDNRDNWDQYIDWFDKNFERMSRLKSDSTFKKAI